MTHPFQLNQHHFSMDNQQSYTQIMNEIEALLNVLNQAHSMIRNRTCNCGHPRCYECFLIIGLYDDVIKIQHCITGLFVKLRRHEKIITKLMIWLLSLKKLH